MRCCLRVFSPISARCRQKQYHGMRAAAQCVSPLVADASLSVPSSPLGVRRKELACALLGIPPSLEHEGPLACNHLSAFATVHEGELLQMLSESLSDVLHAPPTSHVAEMWSPSLQGTYVRALLQARAAASGVPRPQRLEAGMAAHRVLSNAASCDVSSFISSRQSEGETVEGVVEAGVGNAAATRWCELIDAYTLMLPDRSPLHELENLPQEIGIGELLSVLLPQLNDDGSGGKDINTIIDVGGGNGFLAAQLAERFHCEALVVDPFTPKHAIDSDDFPHWGESSSRQRPRLPRLSPLRRIPQRVAEVDWERSSLNFDHCAMIAKHLCGTAVDTCLQHLQAIDRLPRVVVIVPCCFNKGKFDDYCNPAYISSLTGVTTEMAWSRWTKLTDWNRSSYQQSSTACHHSHLMKAEGHGKKKKLHQFLPCMDDIAFTAEAIINYGRVLWLRQHGYKTVTVSYVPRCVTPKNRAIVAVRDIEMKHTGRDSYNKL